MEDHEEAASAAVVAEADLAAEEVASAAVATVVDLAADLAVIIADPHIITIIFTCLSLGGTGPSLDMGTAAVVLEA